MRYAPAREKRRPFSSGLSVLFLADKGYKYSDVSGKISLLRIPMVYESEMNQSKRVLSWETHSGAACGIYKHYKRAVALAGAPHVNICTCNIFAIPARA